MCVHRRSQESGDGGGKITEMLFFHRVLSLKNRHRSNQSNNVSGDISIGQAAGQRCLVSGRVRGAKVRKVI